MQSAGLSFSTFHSGAGAVGFSSFFFRKHRFVDCFFLFTVGARPVAPWVCRRYYKQPGHPQHELTNKGGRFSKQKSMETWNPADPKGLDTKKPIRDYTEV